MSLMDKTIFRPEFFQKAGSVTVKVASDAQVLIRPAVIGIGLGLSLAFANAAAGESVCVLTDADKVIVKPASTLSVESTLTRDGLKAALLAKHGPEGLKAKLKAASKALRKNVDDDDPDVNEAVDAVRAWLS